MSFSTRHRAAAVTAAATFASLLGAGGAFAQTPSSASVQAGPLALTSVTSQLGPVSIAITPAPAGPAGASANADTQSGQGSAQADTGTPGGPAQVQTDPQLAGLQSRVSAAQQQLQAAAANGASTSRARVRALHRRVRSLRRQAARRAARVRDDAVTQAQSSADGAWLVVSGSGAVVDQSGGMTVNQLGTGTYSVSFNGTPTCLTPAGGSMQLQVTGPNGPVNGGFFLASTC